MRPLSRLENSVLGLVWKGAPCTAYWVRRQFQGSPSSHFSGSAGAVYPALARLEKRGLVHGTPDSTSRRSALQYRLTAEGEAALRAWIGPPLPDDDVTHSTDPVRTRVYLLDALPDHEQLDFVRDALLRIRAHATVVRADYEARRRGSDPFLHLGALGVLREIEARIAWLEEVETYLTTTSG